MRNSRTAVWTMALVGWLGLAAPAEATLISEFLYDAPGSDNGFGFVELAGPAGQVLDGWSLMVINGANGEVATTIALAGAIPADRVYVVADRGPDGGTEVPAADHLENFDIQNGPDSLQLVDADGALLDAVGFGEFGPGDTFAGEGTPALEGPPGTSLARRYADQDSDDNGADFVVLDAPTPGLASFLADGGPAPSPSTVPEPGAAVLCGLGLVALGARRRCAAIGRGPGRSSGR